jgi:beta-lactamase regulating signal transducer with metallopeptidase domain
LFHHHMESKVTRCYDFTEVCYILHRIWLLCCVKCQILLLRLRHPRSSRCSSGLLRPKMFRKSRSKMWRDHRDVYLS